MDILEPKSTLNLYGYNYYFNHVIDHVSKHGACLKIHVIE